MKKHTPPPAQEHEPAIIGDSGAVDEFLKSSPRKTAFPGDALANHIHLLLELHPSVAPEFADVELGALSRKQKISLIHNINSQLGIKPLKRTGHSNNRIGKRQKLTMKPTRRLVAAPMNSDRLLCR